MISSSFPEPLCDVTAQMRALRDPTHPKDAVWLAKGTPVPDRIEGLIGLCSPFGVLLTTSRSKARQFQANPSDETLASILGYVEPKWRIEGMPVMVRARDEKGSVVIEMLSSSRRIEEAIEASILHGEVEVTTLEEALRRRFELCALER